MESMTVEMDQMSRIVSYHAQSLISSVNRVDVVFWIVGDVMEMLIVRTAVTKTQDTVTKNHVIQKPNSVAKMAVAFQNCGCVISIMIVVTILMSQLTCVDKEIVPLAGNVVPANQITDAFPSGCSAMAKTIVEIIVMRLQKIVQLVIPTQTSNVIIIVVYRNNGLVTLLMTVGMDQMKPRVFAKENTENVLSQSSTVEMENVFRVDGAAIMKTIVEIPAMS
jgi:hypothetical protein